MRRHSWIICACALVGAGIALQARGQTASASPDRVLAEVRQLRMEVIQLLASSLEDRIDGMERELAQLRERQREFESTEEMQRTQLQEADQQLSTAEIDADTRVQIEGLRQQLTGPALQDLKAGESSVAARQAALSERLERDRQRIRDLRQKERELAAH